MADYDPYTAALFRIESGGNPGAVTGSNRGLGQFGPAEEAQFGLNDSNRTDPGAQASAVARERAKHDPILRSALGRDPTDAEHYIMHQQGIAGGPALLSADPNTPAWQVLRKFYPNDRIAQQAITGNIPSDHALKGVPAGMVTAGDFTNMWRNRFDRELQRVGGGSAPMQAAFQRSQGPMAAAASDDTTGSVPQGRQMPTPMDEASSPGILDRLTQNIQNPDRVSDALGNAGAWLMARDNPAGGAALLAGLKKDKNTGEWSHTVDPNTGLLISQHNKSGAVRFTPIPTYNTNKAADEARLKEEGKADVELDTKLGEYGATLGSKRADLNEALKTFKELPEGGLWNTDQGIAAQRLARGLGIPGFDTLSQVEKARAIAERLALQANTANGMRLLPGSESNSDRQKLEQMQANPVNTKAANMELLGIAERGLKREEDAYKIHQGLTGSGFKRKAYYDAIEANDKRRAAEAAAAPPQPTAAPLQLPKGVKSIQLIQ